MPAHELRNALSPLSTAASILKKAGKDEAIIENLTKLISRQVMHMARRVDDLLDVSRVHLGLPPLFLLS
jgi:nitrogen-specific signal transduction histidine kinase